MITKESIGCCGAVCGTCPALAKRACKGCKLGYASGERDITKARCRMKVCCMSKKMETCADCTDYYECGILKEFFGKNGYKYRKYREALEFIKERGYDEFLENSSKWTMQYGKYK
jgi:hypothetical protein